MADFITALRTSVRSALCRVLSADARVQRVFRRNGVSNDRNRDTTERFRRLLCSNPDRPMFGPQFLPGGCPTTYQVDFDCGCVKYGRFGNPNVEYVAHYQNQVSGPLIGFVIQLPGVLVGGQLPGQAPPIDYGLNGSPNVGSFFASDPNNTPKNNGDNQAVGPVTNLTIVRVDGLPDNCLPDDEPQPETEPFDITYVNFEGDEVTELGDLVVLAPILNLNGDLEIPLNIDIGELRFEGGIDINGDLNIDLGIDFPGGEDGEPTDPDAPPDEEPPEFLGTIIGARVVVLSNADSTVGELQQDANPDLFIPRAGTISFFQNAGLSPAWCRDIDVRSSPAWVPCPPPGFAFKVAGTPSIGIRWSITPVFKRVPEEEE